MGTEGTGGRKTRGQTLPGFCGRRKGLRHGTRVSRQHSGESQWATALSPSGWGGARPTPLPLPLPPGSPLCVQLAQEGSLLRSGQPPAPGQE